jgi:hypothetical protein
VLTGIGGALVEFLTTNVLSDEKPAKAKTIGKKDAE